MTAVTVTVQYTLSGICKGCVERSRTGGTSRRRRLGLWDLIGSACGDRLPLKPKFTVRHHSSTTTTIPDPCPRVRAPPARFGAGVRARDEEQAVADGERAPGELLALRPAHREPLVGAQAEPRVLACRRTQREAHELMREPRVPGGGGQMQRSHVRRILHVHPERRGGVAAETRAHCVAVPASRDAAARCAEPDAGRPSGPEHRVHSRVAPEEHAVVQQSVAERVAPPERCCIRPCGREHLLQNAQPVEDQRVTVETATAIQSLLSDKRTICNFRYVESEVNIRDRRRYGRVSSQ